MNNLEKYLTGLLITMENQSFTEITDYPMKSSVEDREGTVRINGEWDKKDLLHMLGMLRLSILDEVTQELDKLPSAHEAVRKLKTDLP